MLRRAGTTFKELNDCYVNTQVNDKSLHRSRISEGDAWEIHIMPVGNLSFIHMDVCMLCMNKLNCSELLTSFV